MSDFIGQNPRFINADLVRLDAARVQMETIIAGLGAIKESSILRATQDSLDDLIGSLIDLKSDLSHAIACAEDAATLKAAE